KDYAPARREDHLLARSYLLEKAFQDLGLQASKGRLPSLGKILSDGLAAAGLDPEVRVMEWKAQLPGQRRAHASLPAPAIPNEENGGQTVVQKRLFRALVT